MMKDILGLAICASLFAPVTALAQQNLFVAVPETEAAMAPSNQNLLEQLRKALTTEAVQSAKTPSSIRSLVWDVAE